MDQLVGVIYIPSFVVIDFERKTERKKVLDRQQNRTYKNEIGKSSKKISFNDILLYLDKAPPTREAPRPLATARNSNSLQMTTRSDLSRTLA